MKSSLFMTLEKPRELFLPSPISVTMCVELPCRECKNFSMGLEDVYKAESRYFNATFEMII